ncbi:uncharacterized protein LOC111276805 [Durio zibethinus]|uniref:Uncharacterized protein LOC111276805 n=1 Tax=Durio zibethinus TaxID=66656 RepID=A0A6P5WSA5_DURZI|nr:uncharacterized protein LOC111276805 [Durio zibethinus]
MVFLLIERPLFHLRLQALHRANPKQQFCLIYWFALKIETLAKDEAKVVKKEMRAEDGKDKKMDTIREKRDSLNLDLEKLYQDSGSDYCKFEQHAKKQQLSKSWHS